MIKILTDIPKNEDLETKKEAYLLLNKLKSGDRVFGNVAEGLKITLKETEKQIEQMKKSKGALDYLDKDGDLKQQVRLLKAGINGEETLAEYCEKIIKFDENLNDIIFFASLSDSEQNEIGEENGYIADSDFLAIYNNNILILDAKNIVTSPDMPIYLSEGELCTVGGKSILEIHSSVPIWRNYLTKNHVPYISIHGCSVIVNNSGACIWRNEEWHNSYVKPIHISELVDFLTEWVNSIDSNENKVSECSLYLLTKICSTQIRKEKNESIQLIKDNMAKNKLI